MNEIFSDVAGVAGIISSIIVLLEYRNNKNREIRVRTEELLTDFQNNIKPVYSDLFNIDQGRPYTRGIVSIQTLAKNPTHIKIISYFEHLGLLWNKRMVDKNMIEESLYGYSVICFNLFRIYVEESRNIYRNPDYCRNWENMVKDLNKRALLLRSQRLSNTISSV